MSKRDTERTKSVQESKSAYDKLRDQRIVKSDRHNGDVRFLSTWLNKRKG